MTAMTEGEVLARFHAERTEGRFEKYTNKTTTCWFWTGSTRTGGYAIIWDGTRQVAAHRWAYERYVGPIPEGVVLDHLCEIRHCVNPQHLEAVPGRINTRRSSRTVASQNAVKTHCPRGHEYTPENTQFRPRGRQCRTCGNEANRRRRAAREWVGLGVRRHD